MCFRNLDLPAYFHEILRRKVEQIHRPHRIAKHQREQAQPGADQPAAPFGADHGVPAAEIDCVFEVDGTPAIFACRKAAGMSGTWTKPKCMVMCQNPSASFTSSIGSRGGTRGISSNFTVSAITVSDSALICATCSMMRNEIVVATRVRKMAVPGTRGTDSP